LGRLHVELFLRAEVGSRVRNGFRWSAAAPRLLLLGARKVHRSGKRTAFESRDLFPSVALQI
jgi:hypothetical protein